MRRAIPLLPNTPSWRGAQLKHGNNFTFNFTFIKEYGACKKSIFIFRFYGDKQKTNEMLNVVLKNIITLQILYEILFISQQLQAWQEAKLSGYIRQI
jgi:hypothetical protein